LLITSPGERPLSGLLTSGVGTCSDPTR
jgi:hypothetical protein